MISKQCIETRSRNGGHTQEDEQTVRQRAKFVLQAGIFVAKDYEDQHDRRQADGDRQVGTQQNAVYDGQWPHVIFF